MYIAGYLGRPTTGRQSLEDLENVMWYKSHINEVLKGMKTFSINLFTKHVICNIYTIVFRVKLLNNRKCEIV